MALLSAVGSLALPRLISDPLPFELAVAAVPALGIAILALPAFVATLLNVSFWLATPLFLLPLLVLLLVPARPLLDRVEVAALPGELARYVPLVVVALIFFGLLTWLGALSPRHIDGWAATAVMRAYRDDLDFAFSGSFRLDNSGWPAVLSYLSWLLKVDPLLLYRTILPPVVVAGSLVATWGLAAAVLRNHGLALLALAVHCLLLLTSITAFGFQPGWQLLFSAAEDKTVAAFVLLPVAAGFLVVASGRANPRPTDYLPFAVLALAVGVIHPFVALLMVMVTTVYVLLRVALGSVRPVAALVPVAACLAALVPAALVFTEVSGKTVDLLSPTGEFFVGNRQSLEALGAIDFLGGGWAIVHHRTVYHPIILVGAVAGLLAIARPRDPGRQYILAALLVVALVAFNPLALRVLSYVTTVQITWRITWLLPVALGLSAAVGLLIQGRSANVRTAVLGFSAVAVAGAFVFAMFGPWTNNARHNLDVSNAPEALGWRSPPNTGEVATALRELSEPGDVVLALPQYNFALPSYTSQPRVVYRGQGLIRPAEDLTEEAERFEDIAAFFDEPTPELLAAMEEKYSVDFLVLTGAGGALCPGEPLARVGQTLIYAVDESGACVGREGQPVS
ncbi:MAG: hypothetical protein GEU28_11665 [Dehalococcoidia bacterium]|nr:hypothetical protein [Dehalococcoidia bacterium]